MKILTYCDNVSRTICISVTFYALRSCEKNTYKKIIMNLLNLRSSRGNGAMNRIVLMKKVADNLFVHKEKQKNNANLLFFFWKINSESKKRMWIFYRVPTVKCLLFMRIKPTNERKKWTHQLADLQMIRIHRSGWSLCFTKHWIVNVSLEIVRPIKMEIYC